MLSMFILDEDLAGGGVRVVWALLAHLPLPVGFALADAALFGYFFQRGFFVRVLCGHDFAHALG